jgi:hypothetical protein
MDITESGPSLSIRRDDIDDEGEKQDTKHINVEKNTKNLASIMVIDHVGPLKIELRSFVVY